MKSKGKEPRQGKSFFDYSDTEKKRILHKAAVEGSKMQRELSEESLSYAYRLCLKMMKLNPKVMAEVYAWNNTAMEFDIPENEELQKKYLKVKEEAEWELEGK